MTQALDKPLWEKIKQEIKDRYGKRWNAFYSGLLVQEYKKRGGKFRGQKPSPKQNPLRRWYKEKWENIGTDDVIVFRPTKRISAQTPLTASEISKAEIKRKTEEKKKIMNTTKNLSKFLKKRK